MKVSTIHLLVFLCAVVTFCFALPVDVQGVHHTNIPHLEPAVYPRLVQAVVGAIARIGEAIGKLVNKIKDGIKKDKEVSIIRLARNSKRMGLSLRFPEPR
jgi:hypothetical protein